MTFINFLKEHKLSFPMIHSYTHIGSLYLVLFMLEHRRDLKFQNSIFNEKPLKLKYHRKTIRCLSLESVLEWLLHTNWVKIWLPLNFFLTLSLPFTCLAGNSNTNSLKSEIFEMKRWNYMTFISFLKKHKISFLNDI